MRVRRAYRRWARRLDRPVLKVVGILLLAILAGVIAWLVG